jgi:YqaJ-like viral recombinase domain
MTLTIYDQFEQGSTLWHYARVGLPTASMFHVVMAKGVKDERSKTRQRYIDDLAAELITGEPTERYRNRHMERGHEWEPDAMAAYVQQTGHHIDTVAFVRSELIGASPDGLIGDDGIVECKTLTGGLMVALRCAPCVPATHLPQVHGLLMVTGRAWCDVCCYSPGFKPYIERVGREPPYIEELQRYLTPFQAELEQRVFDATDGEYTFKALRRLRDTQLQERLAEELGEAA